MAANWCLSQSDSWLIKLIEQTLAGSKIQKKTKIGENVHQFDELSFFFVLPGFSFTNIHDSRDSRGRGRLSL